MYVMFILMAQKSGIEKKLDNLAKLAEREFRRIREEMATKEFVEEHVEKKIDELAQATDGAFRHNQQEMAEVRSDMQSLQKEMERMSRTQESMLKILESIEGRLREMADHEVRIRRLEKTLFKS